MVFSCFKIYAKFFNNEYDMQNNIFLKSSSDETDKSSSDETEKFTVTKERKIEKICSGIFESLSSIKRSYVKFVRVNNAFYPNLPFLYCQYPLQMSENKDFLTFSWDNPMARGFTNLRLTVISHSMEKLLCEKLMPFKPSKTVPGLHEKTHYYLHNFLW